MPAKRSTCTSRDHWHPHATEVTPSTRTCTGGQPGSSAMKRVRNIGTKRTWGPCRQSHPLVISWPALNQTVCALRFFYGVTLGHAEIPERIAYAHLPCTLPMVLSADEVV